MVSERENKNNTNTNSNGGGQECPPHNISVILSEAKDPAQASATEKLQGILTTLRGAQ